MIRLRRRRSRARARREESGGKCIISGIREREELYNVTGCSVTPVNFPASRAAAWKWNRRRQRRCCSLARKRASRELDNRWIRRKYNIERIELSQCPITRVYFNCAKIFLYVYSPLGNRAIIIESLDNRCTVYTASINSRVYAYT